MAMHRGLLPALNRLVTIPAARKGLVQRHAHAVESTAPEGALQPKKTYTAGDKRLMEAEYAEEIGYLFGEKVPPLPAPSPPQTHHPTPNTSSLHSRLWRLNGRAASVGWVCPHQAIMGDSIRCHNDHRRDSYCDRPALQTRHKHRVRASDPTRIFVVREFCVGRAGARVLLESVWGRRGRSSVPYYIYSPNSLQHLGEERSAAKEGCCALLSSCYGTSAPFYDTPAPPGVQAGTVTNLAMCFAGRDLTALGASGRNSGRW
jgi:hypothetical protein